MAGHSKWANIQHRKRAQDAKKGQVFTKIIREITTAAKQQGTDPDRNPRLRSALELAKQHNLAADTVARALKRASCAADCEHAEEVRYEAYGPGSVALLITALTDNRNRTITDVRTALAKNGGRLTTEGAVAYLFEKCGYVVLPGSFSEEQMLEWALALDVQDCEKDGEQWIITVSPAQWTPLQSALQELGLPILQSELTWLPLDRLTIDASSAGELQKLIDILEGLDDVQEVYHNAVWPPE